jgi:diadenosine tetraphosphate (Ap4A) HIT family hydrolase
LHNDAFCNGKALKTAFMETKQFMVIYDARPMLPGHSLIIPKRHILHITDLTNEEILELRVLLRKLIPRLLKSYNADSYNIAVNAGEHAGMAVKHLHFHILPRNAKDIYQGNINSFYSSLQLGRYKYIKDVNNEVARLRRIFKYKQHKK